MRIHFTQTNLSDAIDALECHSDALETLVSRLTHTFNNCSASDITALRLKRGRMIALTRKLKAAQAAHSAANHGKGQSPCQTSEV